jgi:hypothetical protein
VPEAPPAPQPVAAAPEPPPAAVAPAVAAEPAPAPAPAPESAEPAVGAAIKPIVLGADPLPVTAPKRGWWKR